MRRLNLGGDTICIWEGMHTVLILLLTMSSPARVLGDSNVVYLAQSRNIGLLGKRSVVPDDHF